MNYNWLWKQKSSSTKNEKKSRKIEKNKKITNIMIDSIQFSIMRLTNGSSIHANLNLKVNWRTTSEHRRHHCVMCRVWFNPSLQTAFKPTKKRWREQRGLMQKKDTIQSYLSTRLVIVPSPFCWATLLFTTIVPFSLMAIVSITQIQSIET